MEVLAMCYPNPAISFPREISKKSGFFNSKRDVGTRIEKPGKAVKKRKVLDVAKSMSK
jgi:hypothetical protein